MSLSLPASWRHHPLVSITLALGLVGGACSSGGSSEAAETSASSAAETATTEPAPETTAEATTTTEALDPAEFATRFSGEGTYGVGVTELALPGGEQVVVWYPAAATYPMDVTVFSK